MICIPKYNEVMNSWVTKDFKQRHRAQSRACFAMAFPYGHMSLHLSSQWGSSRSPASDRFHGNGHIRTRGLALVKQGSDEDCG